jgi:flagellar M-ring protein FliF
VADAKKKGKRGQKGDGEAEVPSSRIDDLRARFEALDTRTRALVLGGVAALAAVGAVLWLSRDPGPDAPLFTNLEPDDAARIVARLEATGVPHALSDGGSTILVPEEQVHPVRLSLASEGLPSGGTVGFELFDEQRFGESDFSEQVKYRRALEGELARTIGYLAGVERARVHLVLPTRTLFAADEGRASASVVLHQRPGWRVSDDQVRGIVNLVASSVRGLAAEDVTLVDGEGRRLNGEGDEEELSGDALEYRESLEERKERDVQQLLDAMLGVGHSLVRVSADVDFSREERTEETFDPEAVATRSLDILEERNGGELRQAEGVPGAASNLPGGEAPTTGEADANLARRRETRNFEVSKVVRRNVEPIGRLRRLHAAVVVDGKWEGDGDERSFTPLSDEELAQIEALVGSALGIDPERGDAVTVRCVPFPGASDETEVAAAGPPGPNEVLGPYLPWWPVLKNIGWGLLALLAFLWLRGAMKRAAKAKAERDRKAALAAENAPQTVSVTDLAGGGAVAGQVRNPALQSPATAEELQATRAMVTELVLRDPEMAARVLRVWLHEEADGERKEAA